MLRQTLEERELCDVRRSLHHEALPLVSVGDRTKTYYYSLEEFKDKGKGKRISNVRYLKGLGSLSLEDWDHVMKNKRITKIVKDRKSSAMLEMAFGKSSDARKVWLSTLS